MARGHATVTAWHTHSPKSSGSSKAGADDPLDDAEGRGNVHHQHMPGGDAARAWGLLSQLVWVLSR
jgi:hypothetical protein